MFGGEGKENANKTQLAALPSRPITGFRALYRVRTRKTPLLVIYDFPGAYYYREEGILLFFAISLPVVADRADGVVVVTVIVKTIPNYHI